MLPDIIASEREGKGYLSTVLTDPTDLPIVYRKWIFGDGVVLEGSGLATVYHTYYPGEYTVSLVAKTVSDQYSIKKEKYIVVNEDKPVPNFVIAQSFNSDNGEYWKFYFDQAFHLIFETNNIIIRSKDVVTIPGKWIFVAFNAVKEKLYIGTYSYFLKEIECIRMINTTPVSITETKTEILPDTTMTIDELKIWAIEKDLKQYYIDTRGRAGYLESKG